MLTIIKDVEDSIFICEDLSFFIFLLIATMTKTMFIHSQQFLFIILFICELITLHKIHMISLFLFILFSFLSFIHSRSWQNNQALDSTLVFIIYNSRTRLHRGIIKQNSKLDHAINFILLDQDTAHHLGGDGPALAHFPPHPGSDVARR